ncbi:syntaxin E [Emiliania huxleyi CCMP1516]|uniref:t-SNARE coiled-coil homology domain-containing protein n=2 Tax=Emiliania huxleyi TaxID=2903 RepID=A0A0D3K5E4_EMIH1|nr:syntaxin E [Emiliania huxleyi CCMP1516]EOD30979.1 syntaxin E [Emiliania huxleyi CCMP1516]|eukprot:XP_005783408.1 syntaxin E [Emiliania huxleyi CCMP1516]
MNDQSNVPSWARAAEPLVPSVNVASVKKEVRSSIKEIGRAADEMVRLGRRRGGPGASEQLLALSTETRERARATSQTLRAAFGAVDDASPDHAALVSLSEEFKAAVLRFQQEAEAASGAAAPSQAPQSQPSLQPLPPLKPLPQFAGEMSPAMDIEAGGGGEGGGGEGRQLQTQQLQALQTNEREMAEREAGITSIQRAVNDVSEIFQDLALLVNEQGTQIDNIQTNIETAAASTTRGVRELVRADASQRRQRKRTCCLMMCVLVIILIIVLAIAVH